MSTNETDAMLQVIQRLEQKIDNLSTELANVRAAAFQNMTTLFGAVDRLQAGQDALSRGLSQQLRRELDKTIIWS